MYNIFYFIASEDLFEGDQVMIIDTDEVRLCRKGEAPSYLICYTYGGKIIKGDRVGCRPLYIGDRLILSMRIGGIFYPYGTHRMMIEKYEKRQRIIEDIIYTGELINV